MSLLGALRRWVCPLLSPYDYFSAVEPPEHVFDSPESWLQTGLCLALLAGAVVMLLALTRRLMIRAARRG